MSLLLTSIMKLTYVKGNPKIKFYIDYKILRIISLKIA